MARVTVEDCIVRMPNRFELVLVAAQRAREVSAGATLTVDRDNDKNPVVALREIADGTVSVDVLHNSVIQGMQKHIEHDEPEDDEMEALSPDVDMIGDINDMSLEDELAEDGMSIQEEPDAPDGDDGDGEPDADAMGDEDEH